MRNRAIVAAALCSTIVLLTPAAHATFKGRNGQLAFAGLAHDDSDPNYEPNEGTDLEIWTVRPDGTKERNLTSDDIDQGAPIWSPDGDKLLFQCDFKGSYSAAICVMRADGTKVLRLTGTQVGNYAGSWSPDGKNIVYSRIGGQEHDADIWRMRADGSGKTKLTEGRGGEFEPRWSPDGKRILFVGDRDGDAELYLMRADGTRVRRLTDNRRQDITPDWGPGGVWILLTTSRKHWYELHLLNVRTGARRKIFTEGLGLHGAVWSPNGKKIAFAEGGNYDIYVMNRDGTDIRRVTDSQREDLSPSWRPR